jgi:CheY-like chemotaxis protein
MAATGGILDVTLAETRSLPKGLYPAEGGDNDVWLRLSIRDTGCGIPPEIMDKIFDPFFTTKERGEGTGMGLSVVHGIVTSINGHILVQSHPGEGSLFTVYLPVLTRHVDEMESNEGPLRTGTERILFVDDEPAQNDLGRQILEHLGYSVRTENDSPKALEVFQKDPDAFDCVITDMTMPKMTGDQLARRILSIRPDIPIILCTGYSEQINEERAAAMGIKGFAFKPLVIREISDLLKSVLDEE